MFNYDNLSFASITIFIFNFIMFEINLYYIRYICLFWGDIIRYGWTLVCNESSKTFSIKIDSIVRNDYFNVNLLLFSLVPPTTFYLYEFQQICVLIAGFLLHFIKYTIFLQILTLNILKNCGKYIRSQSLKTAYIKQLSCTKPCRQQMQKLITNDKCKLSIFKNECTKICSKELVK